MPATSDPDTVTTGRASSQEQVKQDKANTSRSSSAHGATKRSQHSLYLDPTLFESLDQAYRKTNHELYRFVEQSTYQELRQKVVWHTDRDMTP
jgi:hypothetical protein